MPECISLKIYFSLEISSYRATISMYAIPDHSSTISVLLIPTRGTLALYVGFSYKRIARAIRTFSLTKAPSQKMVSKSNHR